VENAPNPEIVVVINNIAPVPEMQQADGYSYKCPYQISLFMHKQLIPIAFPAEEPLADGASLLAMDVGGTKIDAALFGARNGVLSVLKEAVYPSKQFKSIVEAIVHFQNKAPLPETLSIAFAGPVQQGKAFATNLGWSIDAAQLGRELGISQVFLLNDLEAEAYGLAALTEHDLEVVYAGKAAATGNAAILAPGTGLGEAGLFWDGVALHPFATEGGHADFAPRDAFDWELLLYLQQQFGHVSWERVLSGPGIYRIFCFLRDVKKWIEPHWIVEQMKNLEPAAAISIGAQEGFSICDETLRLFVRYLAIEASNLALKMKSTGGIYMGGGILPKIWNSKLRAVFLEHFFEVGRLRSLLEDVPVYLVRNQKTALLGAAQYGAHINN
jgi:glucokinase